MTYCQVGGSREDVGTDSEEAITIAKMPAAELVKESEPGEGEPTLTFNRGSMPEIGAS